MSQVRVLLISQRTKFLSALKRSLGQDDIHTHQVERWEQSQTCIDSERPQLIVLDCPGSGVNGLAICREIRSRHQGLLVLISGDTDEQLHILALSMGVDVSLASSAGLPLIAAQIKALLRRFAPSEPPIQTFGQLTVDAGKRDVFVAEQAVKLSTVEFNLFCLLVKNAGCVVSRDDLHRDLYHSPYNGYDRGIDLYVSRIRQKIGDDPVMPRYLKSVRGVGYQFVAETD